MRKVSKVSLGLATLAATALSLGLVGPATADPYPTSGDAVLGGSDTIQYTLDFVADGTPSGGAGFNVSKSNRMMSFDATGDANGRATYNADGTPLATTIVMRAGNGPVPRPNGSHGGAGALFNAQYFSGGTTAGVPMENIARMSGLPYCTLEDGGAAAAGFGGLHTYKFATENLTAATATVTNAPSTISIADLVKIYDGTYTTWNQIPGNSGGSTATIDPLIPQPGSGTRSTFEADLTAAGWGGTYGPAVRQVQENDYAALDGLPNAIAPFSNGRIGLNNSGFFGAAAKNKVVAVTGTGSYVHVRNLYLVVRQNDITSTTPYLPGSPSNFVQAIITNPNSAVRSPAYAANIAAAGQTPAFQDLGRANVAGTSCDGSK
ncbi:MAG: hypothetical protein GC157_14575 [Frankiales bacterium]|nr:hypothetical protein [Frankiales bacterium]